MKKYIAFFLVFTMALSLIACGGNDASNTTTAAPLGSTSTEANVDIHQFIADRINETLQSEAFAEMRTLYADFTGNAPSTDVKVTNVTHYQIDDFEKAKIDCYLVNVAVDYAHWVDKEADHGSLNERLCFYIDINAQTSYDHISVGAGNVQPDLSTELGRATYLVGIYEASQSGSFQYDMFVNDQETKTELPESELEVINNSLMSFVDDSTDATTQCTQPEATISTEEGSTETTQPAGTDAPSELPNTGSTLTEEQQLIADAINGILLSDQFGAWQELYTSFTGNAPRVPEITRILRYQLGDFDGEEMDCYLVDISADVAFWVNEAADEGAIENSIRIIIDRNTKTVYDAISTDAGNFNGDTSTTEGRFLYLLWMFGNMQNGTNNSDFVTSMEITTELDETDMDAISAALTK